MDIIQEFSSIIDEIDLLLSRHVDCDSEDLDIWKTRAEIFLTDFYGENSLQYKKIKDIKFTPFRSSDAVSACAEGLLLAKKYLNMYLEQYKNSTYNVSSNPPTNSKLCYNKVFIVCGNNGELTNSVARLIERQNNLMPIILNEKNDPGITSIEKLEKYSDVAGAICLFTADDLGKQSNETDLKLRAHQDVVFESGYFIGKLGRNNVILLCEKGVEMPSALNGIVYTEKKHWKIEILKSLKVIGYNIDFNKL